MLILIATLTTVLFILLVIRAAITRSTFDWVMAVLIGVTVVMKWAAPPTSLPAFLLWFNIGLGVMFSTLAYYNYRDNDQLDFFICTTWAAMFFAQAIV